MRRTGFLRSKCKSVIILLSINQFQQFKKKLIIKSHQLEAICVDFVAYFENYLNFVKSEI